MGLSFSVFEQLEAFARVLDDAESDETTWIGEWVRA
jgi:hypothetical protein